MFCDLQSFVIYTTIEPSIYFPPSYVAVTLEELMLPSVAVPFDLQLFLFILTSSNTRVILGGYAYSQVTLRTANTTKYASKPFSLTIFYLVPTRKLRNFQNVYFINTTNLCVQHLYLCSCYVLLQFTSNYTSVTHHKHE